MSGGKRKGVAFRSSDRRQPARDRDRARRHATGGLPANAARHLGQPRLADDLSYDPLSFTGHHFHIEGFDLSNNPVLLDLYFESDKAHPRRSARHETSTTRAA